MKATITKEFRFSADGINVTTHPPGDVVEGDVARAAVAQKSAKPLPDTAAKKPPSNKAMHPPQNKSDTSAADDSGAE